MSTCLDDDAIAALLAGAMQESERAATVRHIDECADCRGLVAGAARDAPQAKSATRTRGSSLGRHVILETVGAGAMGVVYAAYDPELDRKVALKVLRNDPLAGGSSRQSTQARLLREAQALARVAHQNVITIYDVGTVEGEVFIAMEFVASGTLGDWLAVRGPKRTVRGVVEMFRQAGEGLAAAHAAGLEHRDFKPDNVLVGADGRVRVTDFGLARRASGAVVDRADGELGSPSQLDTKVTRTGALVGTPAYMAPERLAGGAGDARSDQFAFCVALYEALHGERPFAGGDVGSLAASIARGVPARSPSGSAVPAWLRRIVVRGLSASPDARFPTMRALLDALAKGSRVRPRVLVAAAVLVAAVPLAVLAGMQRRAAPVCAGADKAWGNAWDSEREASVRAAFTQSGAHSAPFVLGEVSRLLGAYRDEWTHMHRDTCEATRVRGEQSEALLDLRMRCLDDRRKQVAALASLLADPGGGASVIDRAVSAALSLPPTSDCANTHALSSAVPLPNSQTATTVAALGDRFAEASALDYAGQYARGLEVARPALEAARTTGYSPLVARLLFVTGRLQSGLGQYPEAEKVLGEGAAVALEAHEDLIAADAWTQLVRVVGTMGGRSAEAQTDARYAKAAIDRVGGDAEREATRLRFLATVVWKRDRKLDEARTLIEQARDLFAASGTSRREFDEASCDEGIAGLEFEQGRTDRALPLHQRVAEVRERLFGGEHPSVAIALVNLGEDLTKLGRADEAIPILERALALSMPRADQGGDAYFHPKLAAALRLKGDAQAALDEDRRGDAASERGGDKDGYWESFALTGIGLDLLALGRGGEAVAPLEHAVDLRTKRPVSFELAESRFALARALWSTGDVTERARARTVAAQARDDLAEDAQRYGSWFATWRDEIIAWLAANRA